MLTKVYRYWQIFWKFRQVQLLQLLEYRGDFLFWGGVSLMWTVFNFFFFDLIVNVSGSIGGWSRYELFVIISVFSILDAFIWSFFHRNMMWYTQSVFTGHLNQLLYKPIDTQFVLMTQFNSYNNIFRFAVGIGMLWWSLQQLNYHPTIWQLLLFLITLLLALYFLYQLWFLMSTISFYVEKLDNINDIIPALRRAWQVPRTIYTGLISTIFTFVIPIGLVTSIPSEILLGKASYWWIGYFAVVTVVTTILARLFFKYSIKHYTGVAN